MTDDQMDDLKQFFTATVSQAETRIKTGLKAELKTEITDPLRQEIAGLRQEMREGFTSIADILAGHNDKLDRHDKRLKQHNRRLTILENKAV